MNLPLLIRSFEWSNSKIIDGSSTIVTSVFLRIVFVSSLFSFRCAYPDFRLKHFADYSRNVLCVLICCRCHSVVVGDGDAGAAAVLEHMHTIFSSDDAVIVPSNEFIFKPLQYRERKKH